MRALVIARPRDAGWSSSLSPDAWTDLDHVRLLAERIGYDFVVMAQPADMENALRQVKGSGLGHQHKALLTEALRSGPLSRPLPTVEADIVVAGGEGEEGLPLGKVSTSEALTKTLQDRRRGVKPKETREALFDRVLLPLAGTACGVRVHDRYMAKNLLDGSAREPHLWLIRRLLGAGAPSVTLISASLGSATMDQRVFDALAALQISTGQFVRLILGPASQAKHDRHIRFQFGTTRRAVAVGLGPGVSGLRPYLDGTEAVTLDDPQTAKRREEAITSRPAFDESLGTVSQRLG